MKAYRAFEASLSEEQADRLCKDRQDFLRWLKLLGVVTVIALTLGQYARWFSSPHEVRIVSYSPSEVCVLHLGWTRFHVGGSSITQCAYPKLKGTVSTEEGSTVMLTEPHKFHDGRAIFELSSR